MNQEIVEKVKGYKLQGFSEEYIKTQLSASYSDVELEQVLHALRYMRSDQSQVMQSTKEGADTSSTASVETVHIPWVELVVVGLAAPTVLAFLAVGAFLSILPIAAAIFASPLLFLAFYIPFLPSIIVLSPFILLAIGAWVIFWLLYKKRYSIPMPRWTSFNTVVLMLLSVGLVALVNFNFIISEILVSILGAIVVVYNVRMSFLEKNTFKTAVYTFTSLGALALIVGGFILFTDSSFMSALN